MNFNIYAIPRSGHNAIINWLVQQDYKPKESIADGKRDHSVSNYYTMQTTQDTLLILPHHHEQPRRKVKDALIKYKDKQIIVDNEHMSTSLLAKDCKTYIDFEHKNIVIIRDVYNNMASVIKCHEVNRKQLSEHADIFMKSWKSHAREYLKDTNYLQEKTFILYNKWFQNKRYRRKIVKKLGLNFTDLGINYVPNAGSGSSFDSFKMQHNAFKMNTLERWKNYIHDPIFFDIIDKEAVELNRRIFYMPNIKEFQHYFGKWYQIYSKYWKGYD